jgi:hypothetical protein
MSDQQLQSSKNELLVLHPKPRVERAVRGEHAQTQLQRDIHSVHPAAKGFLEGCVLFYHHLKEGMQCHWATGSNCQCHRSLSTHRPQQDVQQKSLAAASSCV